ncbi:hypothetical protein BDB01DRAFT_749818, partial [Pilobolus umbonatus]
MISLMFDSPCNVTSVILFVHELLVALMPLSIEIRLSATMIYTIYMRSRQRSTSST